MVEEKCSSLYNNTPCPVTHNENVMSEARSNKQVPVKVIKTADSREFTEVNFLFIFCKKTVNY